jgi:hypothetical protein
MQSGARIQRSSLWGSSLHFRPATNDAATKVLTRKMVRLEQNRFAANPEAKFNVLPCRIISPTNGAHFAICCQIHYLFRQGTRHVALAAGVQREQGRFFCTLQTAYFR